MQDSFLIVSHVHFFTFFFVFGKKTPLFPMPGHGSSRSLRQILEYNGEEPSFQVSARRNLEDGPLGRLSRFLLGVGLFSGAFAVSFREGILCLRFKFYYSGKKTQFF